MLCKHSSGPYQSGALSRCSHAICCTLSRYIHTVCSGPDQASEVAQRLLLLHPHSTPHPWEPLLCAITGHAYGSCSPISMTTLGRCAACSRLLHEPKKQRRQSYFDALSTAQAELLHHIVLTHPATCDSCTEPHRRSQLSLLQHTPWWFLHSIVD